MRTLETSLGRVSIYLSFRRVPPGSRDYQTISEELGLLRRVRVGGWASRSLSGWHGWSTLVAVTGDRGALGPRLTVEIDVVDVVSMTDDVSGSMLDGLEGVPWNTFGAAGPAVPAALRRLASGDERSALDAVHNLGDTLVCNGLVSNAAPLAIPYMVHLAGSGVCSVELLDLLGFIGIEDANSGDGASRDVLADNIELLRPLLAHEDPDIRESAVLVLSTVGGRSDLERILELWGTEANIRVRVGLLAGSARLDPDLAVPLIQEAMSQSESEEVRVASLVASAEVGASMVGRANDNAVEFASIGNTSWPNALDQHSLGGSSPCARPSRRGRSARGG